MIIQDLNLENDKLRAEKSYVALSFQVYFFKINISVSKLKPKDQQIKIFCYF